MTDNNFIIAKQDLSHLLEFNIGKNRSADLVGRRFTHLVVTEKAGKDKRNNALWSCVCDCGGSALTRTFMLTSGRTKSCGSLQVAVLIAMTTKERTTPATKTCSTCKAVKDAGMFGVRKSKPDGLTSQCNNCKNVRYKQENNARVLEGTTYRKSRVKRATPLWSKRADLLPFYELAQQLKNDTGIDHHVDHIIPLLHEFVCGLHCPANLQVIPWRVNLSKGNKWQIAE
ncbi:MAG: hypothetical protein JWR74_2001 [Polaromonas sp.]|nr:hypothetical protein [Polaromonas sp.]